MIRTLSAQVRKGWAVVGRVGVAAVLEVVALDGELVRTRSEIEREAMGRDVVVVAGPGVGLGSLAPPPTAFVWVGGASSAPSTCTSAKGEEWGG